MKLYLDIALLTGVAIWAVLEFYVGTESGLLNALVLLGIIVRFGLMPTLETAQRKEPKCPEN